MNNQKPITPSNDKTLKTDGVVVIVGAGAMGCLLGGLLLKTGLGVVFKEPVAQKRQALSSSGLELIEGNSSETFPVTVNPPGTPVKNAQMAIVCVKAYDTLEAGKQLAKNLKPQVPVLTLQNGLGNVEALSQNLGSHRVLAGTISLGAHMPGPCQVVYAGHGDIHMGEVTGEMTRRLKSIANNFQRAGVSVHLSKNVSALIWSKLIINVGINALTSVLGVPNGALLAIDPAKKLMKEAVREALEVAQAEGVTLDAESLEKKVYEVAQATASNRSSMLMDRLKGRQTEIDYINGAVVRKAATLGLKAPINRVLTHLIQAGHEARLKGLNISNQQPT